jgi:hypothetical protein
MPGRSEPSELGSTRVGIEHVRDVGDLAFEDALREGVEADFGGIAEMNFAEIILENIAEYPDLRKIGDGEKVGSVIEALHAFRSGDILLDDGAGYGSL